MPSESTEAAREAPRFMLTALMVSGQKESATRVSGSNNLRDPLE